MGLGAISLTGEKALELKKELLEKGEALYKEGSIKNEELKRENHFGAIETWTIKDVEKRNTAKKNNLNYVEFFTLKEAIYRINNEYYR